MRRRYVADGEVVEPAAVVVEVRDFEVLELHAEYVASLHVLFGAFLLALAGDLVVSAVQQDRQVAHQLVGHRLPEVLDQVVRASVDQREALRLHVLGHQYAHDFLHLPVDLDLVTRSQLGLLHLFEQLLVLHEDHLLEVHDCLQKLAELFCSGSANRYFSRKFLMLKPMLVPMSCSDCSPWSSR